MKHASRAWLRLAILAGTAFSLLAGATPSAAQEPRTPDVLYVGDTADDTVKRFDAQTGQFLGTFIPEGTLHGPRGILHAGGNFLVSNQNVGLDPEIPGEIDRYNASGGSLGALVPHDSPNAPFAPRGIILGPDRRTLYVADMGVDFPDCVPSPTQPCGAVKRYDVSGPTARFLGDLDFTSFTHNGGLSTGEFRPRALVFGPDGRLYVSLFSEGRVTPLDQQQVGFVLRYTLGSGRVDVVGDFRTKRDKCSVHLHRPEGLAFGPDGRLYVTSFRADGNDVDRVLIFDAARGACVDEIELDRVGQPRSFAQALLFGPGGDLFVPISGGGPEAGAVRRYNIKTKRVTNFVLPGGPLGLPWYLTFGNTNPVTLAY
jgi:sugar lactone lactonase YvrE